MGRPSTLVMHGIVRTCPMCQKESLTPGRHCCDDCQDEHSEKPRCARCHSLVGNPQVATCPSCGIIRPPDGWTMLPIAFERRFNLLAEIERTDEEVVYLAKREGSTALDQATPEHYRLRIATHYAERDRFSPRYQHEAEALRLEVGDLQSGVTFPHGVPWLATSLRKRRRRADTIQEIAPPSLMDEELSLSDLEEVVDDDLPAGAGPLQRPPVLVTILAVGMLLSGIVGFLIGHSSCWDPPAGQVMVAATQPAESPPPDEEPSQAAILPEPLVEPVLAIPNEAAGDADPEPDEAAEPDAAPEEPLTEAERLVLVKLASSPPGASVFGNGGFLCKTPCEQELVAGRETRLRFKLSRYDDVVRIVEPQPDGDATVQVKLRRKILSPWLESGNKRPVKFRDWRQPQKAKQISPWLD